MVNGERRSRLRYTRTHPLPLQGGDRAAEFETNQRLAACGPLTAAVGAPKLRTRLSILRLRTFRVRFFQRGEISVFTAGHERLGHGLQFFPAVADGFRFVRRDVIVASGGG